MGSSGYCFELERVSGKATDARVKSVLLNTLIQVWAGRRHSLLPYDWKRFACDWICLGEDSLLTIEVSDGDITFWFYESVGWSEGLAEHWLRLALAARRGDFEAALGRIGFRINPKKWPNLKNEYENSRYRYFHGDGGIGESSSDGIYWQVKNGQYEAPSTPVDELSPAARAEYEQVLSTNRCRCGVCKSLWAQTKEPEEVPGFTSTRIGVFPTKSLGLVDIRPEGTIVSTGGRYEMHWTGRVDSMAEPWAGIVELSDPNRQVDAIFSAAGTLVAHAITNSGQRYISTSTDGGRTWSEQKVHSGLGKTKKVQFFCDAPTNSVYAAPEPAKTLLHSKDGGQTFDVLTYDLQINGQPIVALESLVVHDGKMFVVARLKQYKRFLAVSEDNGASFKTIAIPTTGFPCRLIEHDGALLCFVQQINGVIALRSTDHGQTFGQHEIGAGSFMSAASTSRGILVALHDRCYIGGGVFFSEDGISFTRVSNRPAQNVIADPSGECIGFYFSNPSLYSLRRDA